MSRAWLGVIVSIALLCLAAAPSLAQGQAPFFNIRPEDAPKRTITKDLGTEQLHFNVSVEPQSQSALADRFSIRLDVTMVEPKAVPNGFGVTLAVADLNTNACQSESRACTVFLKPGQKARFVVTVTNTAEPDTPQVDVKLEYQSTPSFEGQPDPLNPITSQLVAGMSQTDKDEAKGSVDLKLDASEKVASFVKRYPFIVLAAAGGIFALGVVLVRKRKGGLSVATESPVQEVLPGRGASFPVQVTNEGGQKESLSLTTSQVPGGWSSILPVERIELGPNETTTIWLTLKSPQTAQPGQHVQVNFVATSHEGASAEALVEAVVVERYGAGPQMGAPAAPAEPEAPAPMEPQVATVSPKRRKH